MKPPSRNRVKPARYILNKKHERRKKKLICSAWKIHEQRALLAGLRRQRRDLGGNGEINFAALKSKIPKRSVQEVESIVVALKNHMVKVVLHNHSRQRNEERRARVPIELWTKLARDMAGSLEEPIAFAFSQMLTICSTEPRSLRHSDPPHEGTPIGPPNGRTIPLRPSALSGSLVHLPRPPRGPAGAQAGQLPTPSSSAPSGADGAPVTPPVSDLAAPSPTSSEIPDSTSSAATPTNRGATGPSAASASLTASVPSALATVVVTSGRHVSAPSTPGTDALNVSMSTCTTPPVSSPLGGATASQAALSVLAKHCPSPASTCTTTTSVSSTSSLFTPTTSSASLSTTSLPIITSSAPTAIPLSTPTIISSSTPTIITTSTPTIVTTSSSATICSSTSIISSSNPTIIYSSTPISSTTTTTSSSSSSFFQDGRSRPCSRSAQEGFPRAMGIRCIVDFEKIYSYLSSAHRSDQEDTLTSMESAVLLDLLLSLPEELPLLDCVGLEKHMIQVYNRLTFPANPKLVPSNMDAGASISTAGSQRVGTEPDGQPHSQSASTDNASSQSGSSSQVTLDWKKAGICPLNPFIVPMQLLARRHSTQ